LEKEDVGGGEWNNALQGANCDKVLENPSKEVLLVARRLLKSREGKSYLGGVKHAKLGPEQREKNPKGEGKGELDRSQLFSHLNQKRGKGQMTLIEGFMPCATVQVIRR